MALDGFALGVVLPCLFGLLASWWLECLLLPAPRPVWRRSWAANATHIGIWLIAFALEMVLFRRPYFAVLNVLAIQFLLVVISRAKYLALKEPFVYPDFEYFTDAIRHPRLYIPFLGLKVVFAGLVGYLVALWCGLYFESSIVSSNPDSGVSSSEFFGLISITLVIGLAVSFWASRFIFPVFDAVADLQKFGFWAQLWAYARAERRDVQKITEESPFSRKVRVDLSSSQLPHLVTIQSESFFDVRQAYSIVKQDVLAGFDVLCQESLLHGVLNVAARGANTVRTEFSFLSGLNSDSLGVHRFNPYRKLARDGVATVASYLKRLGYKTICVHPFHREFYRRDSVLPLVGFDEFIDISFFSEEEKTGPYVGDVALGNFVANLLKKNDGSPLYIHVITMENHGPLHWEKVDAADAAGVLNDSLPDGCADLVAYARHLRNADAMFSHIRKTALQLARPSGICIFGDHVPIMPGVYQRLGEVPGTTNFLIWKRDSRLGGQNISMKDSDLGREFLCHMGLI